MLAQFDGDATAAFIDFNPLLRVAGDLITFVTKTDEPDPFKREGLPIYSSQLLIREQMVLDSALLCVTAPFRSAFKMADLAESAAPSPKVDRLKKAATLCMLLCRHVLRDNSPNKRCTGRAPRYSCQYHCWLAALTCQLTSPATTSCFGFPLASSDTRLVSAGTRCASSHSSRTLLATASALPRRCARSSRTTPRCSTW